MKKHLIKFAYWLLEVCGEKAIPSYQLVVLQNQRIVSGKEMSMVRDNHNYYLDYIKQELAKELVGGMIKEGYIEVTHKKHQFGLEIRVRVKVLPE